MKYVFPLLILLLEPLSALHAADVAAQKPNIVVLLSDDAGFNEFSMHGSKVFQTPNIDSIAKGGVHFTTGYTSGTVCSPTRAGLLTGRYQNRFGHEFNIPPAYSETNGLTLEETTIADVLKANGYRTIALGKWHLGYAPRFHPMERGFTDYYGFLQGQRSYFPLDKPTKLNELLKDREPVEEKFEYLTDELGRAAAEYIAQSKEKPFFMYLAFNATHGPNHALQADIDKLPDRQGNAKHRAMSAALDRAVGVVLAELDKQNLTDNTLVFFVNDNGGVAGHDNTPLRGHKGQTWEGGTRIPFAMRWPRMIPKATVFEHPVMTIDIFPTALAAAGIAKSPGKPLDGVNLLPFATGKNQQRPHQTLFWKNGNAWAVRDGDLKLVRGDQKTDKAELFDLATDKSESKDLAASRREDVTRLTMMYEDWKRDFPQTPWRQRKE